LLFIPALSAIIYTKNDIDLFLVVGKKERKTKSASRESKIIKNKFKNNNTV